jgi:hypothetical protein
LRTNIWRQNERLRINGPARLVSGNQFYTVHLEDLSPTGARVSGLEKRVTTCALQWFCFEALGQLLWFRMGFCGIRFFRDLTESCMLQTRERTHSLISMGPMSTSLPPRRLI